MASSLEITDWAQSLGLPICIGELYAAEHGGALPADLDALCQWANATGRRSVPPGSTEAQWACTPLPPGGTFDLLNQWVIDNPFLAIVVATVAGAVLFGGRRRWR